MCFISLIGGQTFRVVWPPPSLSLSRYQPQERLRPSYGPLSEDTSLNKYQINVGLMGPFCLNIALMILTAFLIVDRDMLYIFLLLKFFRRLFFLVNDQLKIVRLFAFFSNILDYLMSKLPVIFYSRVRCECWKNNQLVISR